MNHPTKTSLLLVTLAGASLATVVAASACDQPPVACSVGRGVPYAAKYTLQETTGDCGTDTDDITQVSELHGDLVGMALYNPPAEGGKVPDLTQASLSIRTSFLGGLTVTASDFGVTDANADHKPHVFGKLKSAFPDENDKCLPASLSAAEQDLPEVPADPGDPADPEDDFPGQAATHVREEWTDVQIYTTASALGTQMQGTYTVTQDACTATFSVLALYPAVDCTGEDADGNAVPNDDLCSPVAQPDKGIPTGSGINPDFKTKCDPDLLLCVLDGDKIPVLKK